MLENNWCDLYKSNSAQLSVFLCQNCLVTAATEPKVREVADCEGRSGTNAAWQDGTVSLSLSFFTFFSKYEL